MGAFIEEALMAEGRGEFATDYSPALLAELLDVSGRPKKLHLHLSKSDGVGGWTLSDIMVLQSVTTDEYGIVLGCSGLIWWLGTPGGPGPIIREKLFVSGANRLSYGDFELNVSGAPIPGWTTIQGSLWIAAVGAAHAGSAGGAYINGDNIADDILVSAEPAFPVVAGQQWSSLVYAQGGAGVGRIRMRTVFAGRFYPPNLLTNGGFESTAGYAEGSTVPGDAVIVLGDSVFAHSGSGHLRMTTTMYAPHANGGFETGTLAGWTDENPPAGGNAWGITTGEKFTGTYSAYGGFGDASKHRLIMSTGGVAGSGYVTVVPGQSWRLQGAIKAGTGADAPNTPAGRCRLVARVFNGSQALVGTFIAGDIGAETTDWTIYQTDFDIPSEVGATGFLVAHVEIEGRTTGRFYADAIEIVRLKGNRSSMGHTGWLITPGRPYQLSAYIRSDGVNMQGQVWPIFRFDSGAGTIAVIMEGSRLGVSNEWVLYTATVVPPSGSQIMSMSWNAEDIIGGAFHIDDVDFRDTDTTSMWLDAIGPTSAATWAAIGQTVTVPTGAVTVHAEIVAEAHGNTWLVDDASLSIYQPSYVSANSVVSTILSDPVTAAPLSVAAGAISAGNGPIPRDWALRNMNSRDALDHFCGVIASPQLEWRVNPAAATIDVGLASAICTDHSPTSADPLIYTEPDIFVESLPAVPQSSADLVSSVLVLGADRLSTSGATVSVSASADNTTGIVDRNGRPFNRVQVVADSAVDHPIYAASLARDTADRNAAPIQSITVALTGDANRGAPPGDWVYAYKPESGLSDAAYATTINGQPVSPARKRVLARTRRFAAGYRLELRRYDGTLLVVVVNWDEAATTTLELADFRPTFRSDPEGGNVGRAFQRFLTSKPR